MKLHNPTPVLRMFDAAKAREFYVDYLGFAVNWEHRFEDDFPLYMEVARDACVLHLSEHHGDCCPGGALRVHVSDIKAFHNDISGKDYKYANPGLEESPWKTREMTVTDPFGNRIVFFEPIETAD